MPWWSGSSRSTIAEMRPLHGGAVERLLAGRGDQHLIAGLAQDQAQSAANLRVVVADEDPLPRPSSLAPAIRMGADRL